MHAHRGDHGAGLYPRRDGDDVRATITSPAFARLAPDLTKHGLEFCHIANPTGVVMPDGRSLILSMDRAANQAKLNAIQPGEGDRFRADIGMVDRDAPLLFAMLGGALWTRRTLPLPCKEAWRRGPRGLAARLGEALRSGRTWLETRYESELVRALFAPRYCTPGSDRKTPSPGRSVGSSPSRSRPRGRRS